MEIKDIISSGLLELYVLGLTSQEENIQVENWKSLYAEVKTEIDNIQIAIEDYAMAHAVAPSSDVKSKILSKLSNSSTENLSHSITQNNTQKLINDVQNIPSKVVAISWYKWLAAASIILLIGSLILSYSLFKKYNSAKSDLAISQEQLNKEKQASALALKNSQDNKTTDQTAVLTQDQLQHQKEIASHALEELDSQKQVAEALNRDINVMSGKYSIPVVLNGTPHSPDALAKIFWIKNTGEVYVDPTYLPVIPSGKQYQLWAIVDGKPESAGMISTKKGIYHIQKMKSFGKAQAFAITLEKSGGSPVPTMDQMYVMAKI